MPTQTVYGDRRGRIMHRTGMRRALPARAGGEQECTVANAAGTFGQFGGGTVFPGNAPGAPVGPFTGIGLVSFDGPGTYIVIDAILSFNGVVTQNVSERRTYTVNPNCTGSVAESGGITATSFSSITATSSLPLTPLPG